MSAEDEPGRLELAVRDLTASGQAKVIAWLAGFGLDPGSVSEVVIDRGNAEAAPTLTVHRYAYNDEGRYYFHPGTEQIAMAEPVTVPLALADAMQP